MRPTPFVVGMSHPKAEEPLYFRFLKMGYRSATLDMFVRSRNSYLQEVAAGSHEHRIWSLFRRNPFFCLPLVAVVQVVGMEHQPLTRCPVAVRPTLAHQLLHRILQQRVLPLLKTCLLRVP